MSTPPVGGPPPAMTPMFDPITPPPVAQVGHTPDKYLDSPDGLVDGKKPTALELGKDLFKLKNVANDAMAAYHQGAEYFKSKLADARGAGNNEIGDLAREIKQLEKDGKRDVADYKTNIKRRAGEFDEKVADRKAEHNEEVKEINAQINEKKLQRISATTPEEKAQLTKEIAELEKTKADKTKLCNADVNAIKAEKSEVIDAMGEQLASLEDDIDTKIADKQAAMADKKTAWEKIINDISSKFAIFDAESQAEMKALALKMKQIEDMKQEAEAAEAKAASK